jgi:DNA-binding transcriptional ArsR family regulator
MVTTSGLRDEIHQMHAHLCSSLADPNRILLLYTLSQAPSNVTDLATETGLPQPSVSRHLRVLRESGLVIGQRDAHSVVYRLADERVIEALDILRGMLAAALKRQGALAMTAAQSHMEA